MESSTDLTSRVLGCLKGCERLGSCRFTAGTRALGTGRGQVVRELPMAGPEGPGIGRLSVPQCAERVASAMDSSTKSSISSNPSISPCRRQSVFWPVTDMMPRSSMDRRAYVQAGVCTGGRMYRRAYVQAGVDGRSTSLPGVGSVPLGGLHLQSLLEGEHIYGGLARPKVSSPQHSMLPSGRSPQP